MDNPLNSDILHFLAEHPEGISEYDLLRGLAEHPFLVSLDCGGDLGLFRRHFALMNGLYGLRQQLFEEGWSLFISALHIRLVPSSGSGESQCLALDDPLASYYLDWQEFDNTGEDEVKALLNGFWTRFDAFEHQAQALSDLGLDEDADWRMIKRRYRSLAAQHHPDKGGRSQDFIRIRRAFEQLARLRGKGA
ncbi:DNA-J related domain-containing protein [Gallaecimonas mangrovi]|uniref:DNA-J related domain-containing protein n=1 Tax=Gallaecimonas mangrovi TaxID=2291597 RepID=UPI000E20BDEA|nr:DNA-J related domain-containing protein [Gallaecimonas mangrovi]